MPALEVLEVSNNPVDNLVYGQPRSADDLLQAVSKQKPPGIYAKDVANKEKPPKNPSRVLLKNILRYKEGIHGMEAFCKKELNAENLHFYLRARKFRQGFKSKQPIAHPHLIAEAKAINDQFVKVKSPEQINFSFDVMSKLRAKFEENKESEINQWVFDEVFDIVSQYLVDEILTRFKTIPENAKLIAQVQNQIDKRAKEKATLMGKPAKPANLKPKKVSERSKSHDLKSSNDMDSTSLSSDRSHAAKSMADPTQSSDLKSEDKAKGKSSGAGKISNERKSSRSSKSSDRPDTPQ